MTELLLKRNGAEQILQGKIKLPYEEKEALNATDATKKLRTAWLKVKTKVYIKSINRLGFFIKFSLI
jgi:hypothetical protein